MNQIHVDDGKIGNTRNVLLFSNGRLFSLKSIRHHTNKHHGLVTGSRKYSAKSMIDFLRKKKYDHIVLYHDHIVNAVVNGLFSMNKSIDGKSTFNVQQDDNDEVNQFIQHSRNVHKFSYQQLLLMAIAWVHPQECELFSIFPKVITVDYTSGTNNESRPLLTMGGKDSLDKVFIFLRVFLPNERRWVFRWIFNVVLHKKILPRL